MRISDFLIARYDEAEAAALADIGARYGIDSVPHLRECEINTRDVNPCDCGYPAHVLADIASKRAVLGVHERIDYGESYQGAPAVCSPCQEVDGYGTESIGDRGTWPCPTLRILASVYADHADYQQEWAP